MVFVFKNRSISIGLKHLIFVSGLGVAMGTLSLSGFGLIPIILLLGLIYLVLRYSIRPLSRFIARLGYSIRWKQEVAITVIAGLFLMVTFIHVQAMNFMHDELHTIQDLGPSQFQEVYQAVNELEDTNHTFFFKLIPYLDVLGVLTAATVGAAMAWSVIDPVHVMRRGMQRMASGDFSESVNVENEDELGELADSINETAGDLFKLQEAILAEERARAIQERFTHVTLAQEEERRRISRELHDGLGPSLASIGNNIRACQYIIRTDPERCEGQLEEIAQGLKGHIQGIRELIYDLRPLALDQLGLTGAVKQQVERFGQQAAIEATFESPQELTLAPVTEVTVFRVVQECLNNIQKHAKASHVGVSLQVMDAGMELRIKDDGRGFDKNRVVYGTVESGHGLLNMQERAELLGGSFSVQTSPGRGCQVNMYIPSMGVEVGAYPSSLSG
ncbi:MAG: histidine kinase [Chloroflexi bacterium]|nr:histidine kinase [Chloroflexota bacterium]MDA1228508.1 histidine kinase [Chloroflexota bacterium]